MQALLRLYRSVTRLKNLLWIPERKAGALNVFQGVILIVGGYFLIGSGSNLGQVLAGLACVTSGGLAAASGYIKWTK